MLLPKTIDNTYHGHRVSLYAFYLITAITLLRSLTHIFRTDGGAQSIATITLDRFTQGGAEAVIFIFALWGISQTLLAVLYVIACVRYRSLIPLFYVLLFVEYAGRASLHLFKAPRRWWRQPLAFMLIM